MKFVAMLMLVFFSSSACSREITESEVVHEFLSAAGAFKICDVGEFSDGGTVSICVFISTGKLWLSHVEGFSSPWSAVYESGGVSSPVLLTDDQIVESLSSWLSKNFKCENLEAISRNEVILSSRDEIAAATIQSLLERSAWSCSK